MGKAVKTKDVGEMTNRLMIDLYKNKIQEKEVNPRQLNGTWLEAIHILETHFGKISRIMKNNEKKLLNLYKTAIRELEGGQI